MAVTHASPDPAAGKRAYLLVLAGIVLGALLGWLWPTVGSSLDPLAKGFIALIKMMISPIIFCTVVLGVASMTDLRALGRVGVKSFAYFEIVSTVALLIGLLAVNVLQPGNGFHVDPGKLDASKVADYVTRASDLTVVQLVLHIIPRTFIDAFTGAGDLLQVLLIAILFGIALVRMGERGQPVIAFLQSANEALFGMIGMIMKLAPLGAGAAMAFTIGSFGIASLKQLAFLMGVFYLSCLFFIFAVLGLIARLHGFSILRLLGYLRAELLTVVATSSSESVLAPVMQKLERAGCARSVVGVVIPAGYSFNLDGTNIYLAIAVVFIAQALDIDLSLGKQLTIIGVAMLTSKGASGVTGAGFVTLAATLTVVPDIPVAGLALILGIDRFMSEARALTNMVGNAVATLVVARWEGQLDQVALAAELSGGKSAAA